MLFRSLADATITLVRRAGRLEPIWKAHREHFYQKAVAAGRSHSGVTLTIGCLNLVLIAAAVGSRAYPGTALVVAIIVTMAVLLAFSRPLRPR